MEDKRVVDYFVVAGLPDELQPIEELSSEAIIKSSHKQDPIVDITVINKSEGETCPPKFKLVEFTPTGFPANLNHGSLLSPEMYLCYRRGRDRPPLTDIGVLYEGKERVMSGCEVIHTTPQGRPANVNNSNSNRSYVTLRRADESAASDTLAVTDVCIILANKGETPPHAFCQINKNLNKGMVGSAVFLCYKKSMAKAYTVSYKPAILARYPYEDDESFPLPDRVAMFCLPLGAAIEAWPAKAQHPLPVFSTFVLTGAASEKVYGSAVTFYEEYPREKLNEEQRAELRLDEPNGSPSHNTVEKAVHGNKCICLLSRWPFFDTCRKFLSYLYRISISGPHSLPIERLVSHFMTEVPFPSPQRPRILVQFTHEAISLAQPEDSPLPLSGASFITLLRNLGPENCMNLLLFALMEHKILIHSLRPAVLTSVAEAVATMIFPFHWQCPYIPLCPISLSGVLNAPCPFIVGVDSRYFEMYDPPSDVTCVDLDTNTISQKGVNWKFLPKRPVKVLRQTLERLFEKLCQEPVQAGTSDEVNFDMGHVEHDFKRRKREIALELVIQETFLRFMACLLKGYKQYLLPITRAPTDEATDASKLFDMQGFLKSRDKAYHKFFNSMMKTQTFIRFIEERSFVSDKDASLAFFDECTEKVDEYKDEPRLIDVDDSSKSERTVFITPPDPVGLPPDASYSYNGFPELQPELFPEKLRAPLHNVKNTPTPNSPMTRRTKQEIRSAQKIAQKHIRTPSLWAKCLLSHCYSLWFIHLPAHVKMVHSKTKAMRMAYDVLVRMQSAKLDIPDEVCYRVLLQLCGVYQQPVLAVKVLFEMKRNGIQPNAITYGFYNKAVLESKWPSHDSRAYLLWNKLRNVIMGVAQFRRAALNARRRSLSLYSNSESDFDRISRASTDSFVDEMTADKVDALSGKADFVNDLVSVDSPALEERMSTGGASDRGYCSMTLEDAKQISSIIESQELTEADLSKLKNGVKVKMTSPPRKTTMFKRKDKLPGQPNFQPIDPKTDEVLCPNLGSIVRNAAGTSENSNQLKVGSCSAAGLLMTSDDTLDESVFGDLSNNSISHSLHINSSLETQRKRQKSAGREQNESQQEDGTKSSHLCNHKENIISNHENSQTLPSTKTDKTCIHSDGSEEVTNDTGNQKEQVNSQLWTDPLTALSGTSDVVSYHVDENKTENSVVSAATSTSSLSSSSSTNLVKTSPISPTHSLRTPVTENDPLGLFTVLSCTPANTDSASTTLTSCHNQSDSDLLVLNLTNSTPSGAGDSRHSSQTTTPTPTSASSSRKNLFIDMEPFSGLLTRTRDSPARKAATLPAKLPGKLLNGSDPREPRVDSSPSDCSSPEAWSPLSTSSSAQKLAVGLDKSQEDIADNISVSSMNSMKTSTPVRRLVARSESFHNVLKSAASVFATKFSEIKQQVSTISTPSKTGSNQSLQKNTMESERLLFEEEEDLLNLHGGNKHISDDITDTYSLDGYFSGRKANQGGFGNLSQCGGLEHLLPHRQLDAISQNTSSSTQSIPQAFFNVAMEVELCSLSRCTSCNALLYDEEIMAGWTPDDSNLNTTCQFCSYKVVPSLQVVIKDWRQQNKPLLMTPSQSSESMLSVHSMPSSAHLQHHHQGNSRHQAPASHRSVTSLSSNENVPFDDRPSSPKPLSQETPAPSRDDVQGNATLNDSTSDSNPVTQTEVNSSDSVNNNANVKSQSLLCVTDIMSEVIDSPVSNTVLSEAVMSESDVTMTTSKDNTAKLIDFSPPTSPTETSTRTIQDSINNAKNESDEKLQTSSADIRSKFISSPSQSVDSDPAADADVTSLGSDIKDGPSSVARAANPTVEVQSHPYLSPLVLRKEMENIMEQEGDMCLTKPEFVDEHPIVFWNLMWYFKRLGFSSHLPGFILTAKSTNKSGQPPPKMWNSADSRHVLVRALWDNTRIHENKGQPMYIKWQSSLPLPSDTLNALISESQTFPKSLMQHVIASILTNDVITPIRCLLEERRKQKRTGKSRCHSIYREILFLSMAALQRDNIDQDSFDREYREAFNNLAPKELRQVHIDDRPPNSAVIWSRKVFGDLEFVN